LKKKKSGGGEEMLALVLAAALAALAAAYNTSSGPQPGKINVHLFAHSHDDVGKFFFDRALRTSVFL
jgi:hypothetical protein